MSIRVAYEEVKKNVKQAFLNLGLTEEQAETCATIHTQSSADGVESHGLNRIPRFMTVSWASVLQMLFSVQSGLQSWRKSMELAVLL